MKCPHCLISFHDNREAFPQGEDSDSDWTLMRRTCPSCGRYIFSLYQRYDRFVISGKNHYHYDKEFLCYPKSYSRTPLSKDVPEVYTMKLV